MAWSTSPRHASSPITKIIHAFAGPLEQYALCASTLQHEGQQPVGFLFDLCMGCRAELRCTRNSCQT